MKVGDIVEYPERLNNKMNRNFSEYEKTDWEYNKNNGYNIQLKSTINRDHVPSTKVQIPFDRWSLPNNADLLNRSNQFKYTMSNSPASYKIQNPFNQKSVEQGALHCERDYMKADDTVGYPGCLSNKMNVMNQNVSGYEKIDCEYSMGNWNNTKHTINSDHVPSIKVQFPHNRVILSNKTDLLNRRSNWLKSTRSDISSPYYKIQNPVNRKSVEPRALHFEGRYMDVDDIVDYPVRLIDKINKMNVNASGYEKIDCEYGMGNWSNTKHTINSDHVPSIKVKFPHNRVILSNKTDLLNRRNNWLKSKMSNSFTSYQIKETVNQKSVQQQAPLCERDYMKVDYIGYAGFLNHKMKEMNLNVPGYENIGCEYNKVNGHNIQWKPTINHDYVSPIKVQFPLNRWSSPHKTDLLNRPSNLFKSTMSDDTSSASYKIQNPVNQKSVEPQAHDFGRDYMQVDYVGYAGCLNNKMNGLNLNAPEYEKTDWEYNKNNGHNIQLKSTINCDHVPSTKVQIPFDRWSLPNNADLLNRSNQFKYTMSNSPASYKIQNPVNQFSSQLPPNDCGEHVNEEQSNQEGERLVEGQTNNGNFECSSLPSGIVNDEAFKTVCENRISVPKDWIERVQYKYCYIANGEQNVNTEFFQEVFLMLAARDWEMYQMNKLAELSSVAASNKETDRADKVTENEYNDVDYNVTLEESPHATNENYDLHEVPDERGLDAAERQRIYQETLDEMEVSSSSESDL